MNPEHARSSGAFGRASGAGAHELGTPQTLAPCMHLQHAPPPPFPWSAALLGALAGAVVSAGVSALRRVWKTKRARRVYRS